jgi:hypothetical protein
LSPFIQLKSQVEESLKNRIALRKNAKALIFADAAGNLTRQNRFPQCVSLYSWWKDTYHEWIVKELDVTMICAHPSSMLKQELLYVRTDANLARTFPYFNLRDIIRNSNSYWRKPKSQPLRILAVEPELDVHMVYGVYLKSLHVELTTVAS